MYDTSYEEFDLVLEEIIETYKLAAKKIHLGAQEGIKVSSSDINALTWASYQVTFVRHLKTLRKLGRMPLAEGLEAIKESYQKQNDEHGEANVALCERLLLTFTPCEVRRSIHTEV
jgi:hypothetical protein